ncbi:zinc ABC transporter ATP-binding protein ZnuC [Photobacterium lutimaris]|uniref:Zinc ABC transporter ATP-binding protein ZnuC n=1 Tax=Photobacterium lutimaris TaxID=388278 RepID=A0A2T3IVR4_9GAMM|nr:zinc ABC transporter ATP-binding protein ZnuC [Photobacterium lutimaris]PSU32488.1 zinc ABC transporter ATP-binding protein ZnuC [Photobacterium lutimaris]TDR77695.1 zinc transport system ATP-binding protein [Photobacterium lutimaris]
MTSLVELQSVTVTYSEKHVLDQVSLKLERKQITTLIGPNGAGKSTLVKVITGLTKPTVGNIIRQKGLRIGYVPQKLALNNTLPLSVDRFMRLAGRYKEAQRIEALELVSGKHLHHSNMHSLSGGEMQRVLLARALLQKPDLLVLDEPVQGVDVNGQLELYSLIQALRDKLNCAILMVSHDLHLVMAKTDHVICLHHHICCSGEPEAITSHPSYVALFGRHQCEQLALYQHHHNHEHDLSGNPVGPCQHEHQHSEQQEINNA